MTITVNGRQRQINDPCNLTELLTSLQIDTSQVAVERNRSIVLRKDFEATPLQEGDQLEIIRFVGGG